MSRRVAKLLPFYEFEGDKYFGCDGAPDNVVMQRKDAFFRLARLYADRYPKGRAMTKEAAETISDLNFTETYRVPFQFSRLVREHLGTSTFMESSSGVTVTDVDGNTSYDLTGSYGVNIFGNDFYKECIEGSEKRAHALGPVLGPYHPVILENVQRLCQISGLDEVSFHMSGTEAVMQAVRLARYHTKRTPSGSLRRRLSRLVGRRAARRRQSDRRARDLHPVRDVGEDAACAAHAQGHRLRAGQSAAGPASERQRARRFLAGRLVPRRSISIARPTPSG